MNRPAAMVAALLFAASGAVAQDAAPSGFRPLHGLDLPASFTGTLPCADCPGIDMQIDLWPDQGFHQRWSYLERDVSVADVGRWAPDPETGALVLRGQDGSEQRFAPRGTDGLEMLALDGTAIASPLNYSLTAGGFDPATIDLPLRGEIVYMADAALFTECVSRRAYPVAFEDAWIDAERLYLAQRPEPGAPLMMAFDARLAPRPPMEGDGLRMTMIPQAVTGAFPGERCPAPPPATLTDTFWRIESLGDMPLTPVPDTTEPHLVLLADDGRYAATAGCNRMAGGFRTGADGALSFDAGLTTLMACPPPLDAREAALTAALSATAGYGIDGDTLRLRDAAGADVAVLRAVWRY